MIKYKQRCFRCKKNYVLVSGRNKFPQCYECQKNELHKEVKDKKMKKFFDIPEEFYENNYFLRNIKIYYLRTGELSEKQIDAFKKTVDNLKKRKNE